MSLVRYLTAARKLTRTAPEADATLLDRFVDARDPEAFAELVRRHGPMVLGVCRRKLGDSHAADDAFQAAFLVLSRKADSVRPREAVGNWLFGVAVRVAAHSKGRVARVRSREAGGTDLSTIPDRPSTDPADAELLVHLDEAIAALPDKYRSAVVLCELEGRTLQQAAEMLEIPLGTVASRLARGRDMLATRLRKLVPAASVAGGVICSGTVTAASANLFEFTVALASDPTLVSQSVQHLTQGVIRHMFLTKLRALATLGGALFTLAGATAFAVAVPEKPATQPPAAPEPKQESERLNSIFGDKAAQDVVAKPTKVQAYRLGEFSVPRATVKEFKMIAGPVAVDDALAKSMCKLLLDEKSYSWNQDARKNCEPNYGVRLEFIQGEKTTDVFFCFDCKILGVYVNGKSVRTADFDDVHTAFVKLVKKMFPEDKVIQGLKE